MLKNFITWIEEEQLPVYGIVVIKDGGKLAEHHFVPEERRNLYSATKSITATAVGLAIGEGYFKPEDDLLTFFEQDVPEGLPKEQFEQLKQVTVERLLTMSVVDYIFERPECENLLKHILSIPLPRVKEIAFSYNNYNAYLAGLIVERTTKTRMMDYLASRLFDPLGIHRVECAYSPEGNYYGSTGMYLTVNELARFGQLYLQRGYYNGRQLIPKTWVEAATRKQIETREGGYGYFFWRYKDNTYRASGKWGQMCVVIPEKHAVIAVMSDIRDEKKASDMKQKLWETVYARL
jgi:CubicO group peptidase (beta-lactamase class C family)